LRIDFDKGGAAIELKGGLWTDVEIAGLDGVYRPAQATFTGNTATVSSDAVKEPSAVRYGWRPVCTSSLVNTVGLPTAPFALWID